VSRIYVALANDVLSFTSDLPIVIVDTARQSIGGTLARVESVIMDTGADGRAGITDPPDFYGRAGIKIRGSSTAGAAKPSYAFEVWDEHNRDREVSILGLPAESDWILYGPYSFDRAQINNALMFDLSNQIGRYAVRTRFVEMYLNRNDDTVSAADYVGLYIFMEKIKRADERVDVEKLEPWDSTEPRIAGGYMLKIDAPTPVTVASARPGATRLTGTEPCATWTRRSPRSRPGRRHGSKAIWMISRPPCMERVSPIRRWVMRSTSTWTASSTTTCSTCWR
jgi:hypothetical protein